MSKQGALNFTVEPKNYGSPKTYGKAGTSLTWEKIRQQISAKKPGEEIIRSWTRKIELRHGPDAEIRRKTESIQERTSLGSDNLDTFRPEDWEYGICRFDSLPLRARPDS